MERASTASTRTARALLWALFAVNVYRAATQSITADEAYAYDRFVRPPIREVLAQYDANNHVLYTLLAKRSVGLFRATEFSLRLPSLLCGALYLWAVYRLTRRTFGAGALFLAAMALLTLHPVVLDYLSAARGYGMALALWMWALELMLECRSLSFAAICLGLSVAANLAFAFPAAALACTFFLAVWGRAMPCPDGPCGQGVALPHLTERFVIPGIVTAFVLLAIPLSRAEAGNFGNGAGSLRQMLQTLFDHAPSAVPGLLLGAMALIAVFAAVRILRRREKGRVESMVVLTAGTTALTFAGLVLARRWFGVPYPLNGSALYLVPLASLMALSLVRKLNRRPAHIAAVVLAGVIAAQYLFQFDARIYDERREDAGARSLVQALRRDARDRRIRIGASPAVEPVLNFYRARYRLSNWVPVERKPLTETFDYYVLTLSDAGLVDERHLHVIYRDSGLVLAH